MTGRMHAGTVMLIAALCGASACAGPGAPLAPSIPREGGGTPGGGSAVGVLAFLVQPRNALVGTVSVVALSGVAFFDTLVIHRAGSDYTLVASATGFGSVESTPFTVSGAIGAPARTP